MPRSQKVYRARHIVSRPLLLLPQTRQDLLTRLPYPRKATLFERWWIDQHPDGYAYVEM